MEIKQLPSNPVFADLSSPFGVQITVTNRGICSKGCHVEEGLTERITIASV